LNNREIILFTNRFPYFAGETFLETEIQYLSAAFGRIIICPQEKGDRYYGQLPPNVEVIDFSDTDNRSIRSMIQSHWSVIVRYYLKMLFGSVHRMKYIRQFGYTWNTLMGFVRRSDWLMKEFCNQGKSGDMVYYSYWFNEWASALAIARSRGLKGRYAVRAHGYDYDEKQNGRGYFPFREAEMNSFDEIAQISDYGAGLMVEQFPSSSGVLVSRLGVNDGGLNAGGSPGSQYRIVSCSGFASLKRIHLMIDILAALPLNYEWIHFGGGAGMKEAEAYAAQKLPPGCFSFRGYVHNAEIRAFYRHEPVDLFINTSILEGIPVSMMEAISAGVPLAGFGICGIPEIVNART